MQAQQTLLVVDGNGRDRLMPGLVLRPFGFTVLECASAQEAMHLLSHKNLAGVLVDVQLKSGGGLEVLWHMRGHPILSKIRVIACIDHATQDTLAYWIFRGFDAVLLKPFRSADLISLLIR